MVSAGNLGRRTHQRAIRAALQIKRVAPGQHSSRSEKACMRITERSFLDHPLTGVFRAKSGSRRLQLALSTLLVSVGYYLGAQLGFALDFPGTPLSIFWPPNAILMAALILAPTR